MDGKDNSSNGVIRTGDAGKEVGGLTAGGSSVGGSSADDLQSGSSHAGRSQGHRRGAAAFPAFNRMPFWLLLLLIPWSLSVWIRLLPASLPQARQWAAENIYSSHREQCARALSADPRTKDRKRLNSLIDREFELYKSRNRAQLDREINEKAASMITSLSYYHGGKRFTYLADYDPYLYLRYARNLISNHLQGDEMRGKGQWDNHVLAPLGVAVTPLLHPLMIASFYEVLSQWDPAVTLMESAFRVPIFLSLIASLGVFLIARRLSGNMAGLLASVLFSVNPFMISRSIGSDTDIYNVMLPILITLFLLEGLLAKRMVQKVAYFAISGFVIGVFSFAWIGWWFILYYLFGSLIFAIPVVLFADWQKGGTPGKPLLQKDGVKELLICFAVFLISAFFSVTLFSGNIYAFPRAWARPFEMAGMKDSLMSSLWPNIFLSVEELQPATLSALFRMTGGEIFFFLSSLGIILIAARRKPGGLVRIIFPLLFLIWMGATYYGGLKGVRFLLLLVPPFAITAGVALAELYLKTSAAAGGSPHWRAVTQASAITVITLMLSAQVYAGSREAAFCIPTMNAACDEALTALRTQSSPDAIVTSYWDSGDFITFGADRAVTVDNHTLEKPPTYWVSRIFTAREEGEALAILRMLNRGSNRAFEVLNGTIKDTESSISMLNRVFTMNKDDAAVFLKTSAGESTAKTLMPLIFGDTREQYMIITGDLINKAPFWGHYGFWDFRKAGIASCIEREKTSQALRSLRDDYGMDGIGALQIFLSLQSMDSYNRETWISPRPAFFSPSPPEEKEGFFISHPRLDGKQYHVIIDRKALDVLVQDSKGSFPPFSLIYCNAQGEVKEKRYARPGFPYSIILAEGESSQIVVSSPELADTLFTRLFFFKGKGLEHFTMIHHGKAYDGNEIDIWKVSFPTTP